MLVRLASAMVAGDAEPLAEARAAVLSELGAAAMVDAVAVAANFERMVRTADGTGIQLDERLATISAEVRAELELERLRHTA